MDSLLHIPHLPVVLLFSPLAGEELMDSPFDRV